MSPIEFAALGLLFLAVFACTVLVLRLFSANRVQQRLDKLKTGQPSAAASPWMAQIIKLSGPLAKLSLPDEESEHSLIRIHFMHAGLRHRSAPALFFTAKSMLAIGLPLLVVFALIGAGATNDTNLLLLWVLGAATLGYYLPNLVLNKLIARRQREVFENFPDALDLMTVCVEAGLAMDAALARVAAEIALKSAVLGDELNLVTLELGAGRTKERALRNLALRTGVEDVEALVLMLIQSERFGTSIAASLRVQSEQLRTKRRQRAEEQAAKIAMKLLFPLIFCIFPSLMLVLLGPALIQIYRVLLPGMSGSN
jgi:tight adherence protein C